MRVDGGHHRPGQGQRYRPGALPAQGGGDDVQGTHDRRPHDRRLAADEQGVADDRRQGQPGRRPPPDHPGQRRHQQARHQRHVLAGHRHQVGGAGGVHVLRQVGRQVDPLAQEHPCGQGRLRLRQGVGQRSRQTPPRIDEGGAKDVPPIVGEHTHPRVGHEGVDPAPQ